jgi:hypothetical protein
MERRREDQGLIQTRRAACRREEVSKEEAWKGRLCGWEAHIGKGRAVDDHLDSLAWPCMQLEENSRQEC